MLIVCLIGPFCEWFLVCGLIFVGSSQALFVVRLAIRLLVVMPALVVARVRHTSGSVLFKYIDTMAMAAFLTSRLTMMAATLKLASMRWSSAVFVAACPSGGKTIGTIINAGMNEETTMPSLLTFAAKETWVRMLLGLGIDALMHERTASASALAM